MADSGVAATDAVAIDDSVFFSDSTGTISNVCRQLNRYRDTTCSGRICDTLRSKEDNLRHIVLTLLQLLRGATGVSRCSFLGPTAKRIVLLHNGQVLDLSNLAQSAHHNEIHIIANGARL